jgi:hypothetical protein
VAADIWLLKNWIKPPLIYLQKESDGYNTADKIGKVLEKGPEKGPAKGPEKITANQQ